MSIFPLGAKVGGEVSGFVGAMASGTRALNAFAGGAGIAGVALGALAGVAAMGAAIGAAKDYQAELVKLNTLVGISTEEIAAWDDQMRAIAVTTGQSARDVAKAMFAITSGGARGSEALELLEIAAKASAIGLGDMVGLGRTAGAMLQAFGDQGLTAEQAMDTLVLTVREGNLEAESLAGAFSRVLGPAKALGSSVQDIGAFMAVFTRLGGSTEQAATGLLNVFNLLIKPPDKAREAMEKYGISVERLRGIIRQDGLQAALAALNEGLNDNVDAFGEVLPNVRALIGVLNTAGLQSEQYAITQANLNGAMNVTEDAFKTWGDSADATFKRFKSSVGEAGLQIGEALLPPLTALLLALTPVVALIGKLVDVTDDLIRAIGRDANPAVDRFFEKMMRVPHAVDAATTEIEHMNAELEAAGFDGDLLTPLQELKRELAQLPDDALRARIVELTMSVAELTPMTDGYTASAIQARRVQGELATELANTKGVYQRRIALEGELAESIDNTEIETAGMVATEEARQQASADLLGSLAQEIELLERGERGMIIHTAALLDDTGALEAAVTERLDHIASLEAEEAAAELAAKATLDNARARESMIDGLQREIDLLTIGADEIMLRTAAELDETGVLEENVRMLIEKRNALEEERIAEEETRKAIDRATRSRTRQTETLARERQRSLRDVQRAAQRTRENLELAKIQDEIRQVTEISQEWADIVGTAFDSIVSRTATVADAFEDMVISILQSLQRLAIQKAIIEPLANALFGALSGGGASASISGADIDAGVAGFGDQLKDAGINVNPFGQNSFASASIVAQPSFAGPGQGGAGGQTVIVEQTLNFNPQFIDGADGARWLKQNEGEIMKIVATGAQRSSGFARTLRGGQA